MTDRLRSEKAALSIAAKETAAERLRLATALRELKERHGRLRVEHTRLQAEKEQRDAELVAAQAALAALQDVSAQLRAEVERRGAEAEGLRAEAARLEGELGRANRLASGRLEQLRELNSAFEQVAAVPIPC